MKRLVYRVSRAIDRKPFHLFAVILVLLNLSGIGKPDYLTLLSMIGFVFSLVISLVLKLAFRRGRPQHNKYRIIVYGFPSGHSHVIFTVATIYSYYAPVFTIPFFLLASFVSMSRILTKAHTKRDVIAGSILGVFTGLLTVWFGIEFLQGFA